MSVRSDRCIACISLIVFKTALGQRTLEIWLVQKLPIVDGSATKPVVRQRLPLVAASRARNLLHHPWPRALYISFGRIHPRTLPYHTIIRVFPMARIRKRVAQFVAHKLEALLEVANMHHKRPSRLSDMILREYQQRRANACSTASASRSSVTSLLGGFATPAPQIPDYSTASEADASGATAKFLHLPPELHLEIITILFHTYPTEKPEHYPLKALRL